MFFPQELTEAVPGLVAEMQMPGRFVFQVNNKLFCLFVCLNASVLSAIFGTHSWVSGINGMVTEARLFFFLVFLGLHPQHIGVPRLGVESEL